MHIIQEKIRVGVRFFESRSFFAFIVFGTNRYTAVFPVSLMPEHIVKEYLEKGKQE